MTIMLTSVEWVPRGVGSLAEDGVRRRRGIPSLLCPLRPYEPGRRVHPLLGDWCAFSTFFRMPLFATSLSTPGGREGE